MPFQRILKLIRLACEAICVLGIDESNRESNWQLVKPTARCSKENKESSAKSNHHYLKVTTNVPKPEPI